MQLDAMREEFLSLQKYIKKFYMNEYFNTSFNMIPKVPDLITQEFSGNIQNPEDFNQSLQEITES